MNMILNYNKTTINTSGGGYCYDNYITIVKRFVASLDKFAFYIK